MSPEVDRMANDLADCDPCIQTDFEYEKMAKYLVESCGWTRDDGAATRAQLASSLQELTERFCPTIAVHCGGNGETGAAP